jgi:excisionase family DNA binding protein
LPVFANVHSTSEGIIMAGPDGEILTLDEVAEYLKAGKRTLYRLTQNGQIPAFKLGGSWRFRRVELDRWIAAGISSQRNQTPSGKAKQ